MVGGGRFHVLRTNEARGKMRILMIRGAYAIAHLKRPGLKRDVTCNKVLCHNFKSSFKYKKETKFLLPMTITKLFNYFLLRHIDYI